LSNVIVVRPLGGSLSGEAHLEIERVFR
jgi:hypothetical protein